MGKHMEYVMGVLCGFLEENAVKYADSSLEHGAERI